MLEFAKFPRPEARLTCQISVTEQLDGLTVRLPESQS
jgi:2Fe-2S ferredoxin